MIFKRKPKINYKDMANITPTSKFDLKMQCIAIARGNVDEAEKLYNFLAGDIAIPDVTPQPPTIMQQIKETAGGLFGFIKENQGDFVQAYNYIQAIRNGAPIQESVVGQAASSTELPPLTPPNTTSV